MLQSGLIGIRKISSSMEEFLIPDMPSFNPRKSILNSNVISYCSLLSINWNWLKFYVRNTIRDERESFTILRNSKIVGIVYAKMNCIFIKPEPLDEILQSTFTLISKYSGNIFHNYISRLKILYKSSKFLQ